MRKFRHKKRGSEYFLLNTASLQSTAYPQVDGIEVVIYRGIEDNKYWVRPEYEFFDGRFEEIG